MQARKFFTVVLTAAGNMEIELVVKPEAVQLFLSDHGKPVKPDGASAKVTLLAGAVKSEVALTPAAGVKAVAVIILPGKAPVTARFPLK